MTQDFIVVFIYLLCVFILLLFIPCIVFSCAITRTRGQMNPARKTNSGYWHWCKHFKHKTLQGAVRGYTGRTKLFGYTCSGSICDFKK